MTILEEILAYHDEMALVASAAADKAGMAAGRGLNAQADKHRRWAAQLRAMLPPEREDGPRLQAYPFVRSGRR